MFVAITVPRSPEVAFDGECVKWRVTESALNSFEQQSEWNGTDIEFTITPAAGQTEVRFTHHDPVSASSSLSGQARRR